MNNTSIKLPLEIEETRNSRGFSEFKVKTWLEHIPADVRSASRSEQMLAHQDGYKAEIIVAINAANYTGQSWLVDEADGRIYDVCREYQAPKSPFVQLTCGRREGGKDGKPEH